jgi:hypothetical protein
MDILIYGTINSVTLALYAIGFAMVYGVSRLPNFAHGALYVVSGFITWSFLHLLNLNYLLSIILALIATAIIGALIYQFVLIRVRGMEISEIIASYAIGLAILEGFRWGGFKGLTYTLPAFIEGSTEIAGVSVDYQRLLVVGIGAAVVGLLWLFTRYTRIGLPLRSRECMIVNPATLEPVPSGESGELLVYSPHTIKGYWNKPDETGRTCVSIDGKVFCRMGDFVCEDEDGELYYVERSADLIKHKGYWISASEVEAILQDHPTVIGACVVRVGERIKAIVVLKEGARGVGSDLIKWCRERLASYKVPAYIEFRDMLPKSKVGKLLRREIRDEERRRVSKGKDQVPVIPK